MVSYGAFLLILSVRSKECISLSRSVLLTYVGVDGRKVFKSKDIILFWNQGLQYRKWFLCDWRDKLY